MANENNSILRVYTAESDELLKKLMYENGDTNRIGILRYPEMWKSPAEQVHAADVLLNLVKNGHSQTVYTHSDHLINRLVRRIVEDGLDGDEVGLVNKVKIFFATSQDEEMKVEEIKLSNTTGIVDWPDGFFDQNINDREATVQASLKKAQKHFSE